VYLAWGFPATSRVNREHAASVPDEWAQRFSPIHMPFVADKSLSPSEVADDLDELEWILENRYSYLRLKGVDYRMALDAIRLSARQGSHRSTLALQIAKLVALFGDGHSAVDDPSLNALCGTYLPLLPEWADGQALAVKPDRSGFLNQLCPCLESLDGLPLQQWLDAAERITASGSAQYRRTRTRRALRLIPYLRTELGLASAKTVRVGLRSLDGEQHTTVELPLAEQMPMYGEGVVSETRLLPNGVGYLRIARMDDSPAFLDGLVRAMNDFRDTRGLIIDVRNNGGGSRAPLQVLFPFFMGPDEAPVVRNVAALRLGNPPEGLDDRWLHPADWAQWSAAERKAVEQFAKSFQPQWTPPAGQFGPWHYLVLSPQASRAGYYHYDRPVIILMNSANFSAADIFLSALKGMPGVTLMGTPSGGGSGMFRKYRLGHSDILLRLSSMASFQSDGRLYDGNGVQPDVLIEPRPADLIGHGDSILDAALARLAPASATQPQP
jgi:hypothetical protein